jgi:hypothetical protein
MVMGGIAMITASIALCYKAPYTELMIMAMTVIVATMYADRTHRSASARLRYLVRAYRRSIQAVCWRACKRAPRSGPRGFELPPSPPKPPDEANSACWNVLNPPATPTRMR